MLIAGVLVLNNQMGGEAMWFWYATVFQHGVKLYSQLHTALQPFFILETSLWLRLVGPHIALYELPSLVHAFLLAWAIFLILRRSAWADWQKAIVLLGTFVFTIAGHSYRFDDYHVLTEAFICYALLLLLMIGGSETVTKRDELKLTACLGVICGLSTVTRITDGAALITASALCLPFLAKREKVLSVVVTIVVAAVTVCLLVLLTGDSFSAYLSNSIFHAASSKGGTGSIFAAPFLMFRNTWGALRGQRKMEASLVLIVGTGWWIARYRRRFVDFIIPVQLAIASAMYVFSSRVKRGEITSGLYFEFVALALTFLMYFAAAFVLIRYVQHRRRHTAWDSRSILILVPILEWASYSAGAAAEPVTNYYAPAALILLLIPVLNPFRRFASWMVPSVLSIMILLTANGLTGKVVIPYSWQNYAYGKLFENKGWYDHPVYGEMFIDRGLLDFSRRVCTDIGSVPGKNQPELLSLPYPYPNYFCATPPWHNYVQTFFDTATRGAVEHLMQELRTSPPQWIVYQRQLNIMEGSERLYNHGHPIAQRELDGLIMTKLANGEWKLVDESSFLRPQWWHNSKETDWYIIQTRP